MLNTLFEKHTITLLISASNCIHDFALVSRQNALDIALYSRYNRGLLSMRGAKQGLQYASHEVYMANGITV
jgi:hypothetical protein